MVTIPTTGIKNGREPQKTVDETRPTTDGRRQLVDDLIRNGWLKNVRENIGFVAGQLR